MLNIELHKDLNSVSSNGFVNTSAYESPVGNYVIDASPLMNLLFLDASGSY